MIPIKHFDNKQKNPLLNLVDKTDKEEHSKIPSSYVDVPPDGSPLSEDEKAAPENLAELNKAKTADLVNTTDLRTKVAKYSAKLAFYSIAVWSIVVLASIIVSFLYKEELLNDTKFIAITSGATVNVFTAFIVVAKGLFGAKDK